MRQEQELAGVTPESEVRRELQAVCRRLQDSDEPYYGRATMRQSQSRLEHPIDDPREAVIVRAELGRELLEQKEPERAQELFEEALRLASEARVDQSLRITVMSYLGLSHMRQAEDSNCILHHSYASCIFPISRDGIHAMPEHARRAGDVFLAILQEKPDTVQARWLLNVARMVSGDYPDGVPPGLRLPASTFESPDEIGFWRDRAPELGINPVDLAGGAALDDFDGDGLLDVVTSTWDPCGSMKAFRNDGAGGFEEVTEAWGLDSQWGGLNLSHADYDNDGDLDLLVLRGAWLGVHGHIRNSLLRNDLHGPAGRFVDVTASAGLASAHPTQAASWADYDGDGDLDLFVGNESLPEDPHPSELFRNQGDGTFTDVAAAVGVTNDRFAKAAAWGDYDEDGDPDLYVSNIGPNRLYRNDGGGVFVDVAPQLGVTAPRGRSFATWFFDFDQDGDLDLFVADYNGPVSLVAASYLGQKVTQGRPLLYRNDGGTFTEVSLQVGLDRPLLPMGANYGDADNDGWPDIYLGTGDPGYETLTPNVLYHNHQGRRFADVTFSSGFGHLQKGHGVAFGDVDNDGDQDLFHQVGGFYPGDAFGNALFENPSTGTAWITLRLEGRKANRFGVGTRIEVRVRDREGALRSFHFLAGAGGSFGESSLQQELGLGREGEVSLEEVILRWPGSGTVQRLRDLRLGGWYRVVEGEEAVELEVRRLQLGASSDPDPGGAG